MQITEALISEPGDIRRFVQQAVDHWPHLLAFYFTPIRQKETSTGNRFMHSVLPFTDRCKNILLSVITLPVQHRRWYYAGCGNNMEEQQYDACCCSARRAFAICGSVPQLMKNVRKWWIYCSRPGGDKRWRTMSGGKVFSGYPA